MPDPRPRATQVRPRPRPPLPPGADDYIREAGNWLKNRCTSSSAPGRWASAWRPGWPRPVPQYAAVSRHRPAALADGVDWRAADATDPEATADAAKGASVVYQCLNAPYNKWPELFPPLQRNVLRAAEHADALLVAMENLYGYGPTGGKPMTEDLPLAATTKRAGPGRR